MPRSRWLETPALAAARGRAAGSSGSTTTIRTRPTSRRRRIWRSASASRRTTARSPSSIDSSAGCCRRSRPAATLARTLVLVTADHGESLGEHGEGTHGIFIYDATLRVPWIMAGPGIAAGRVATTVARGDRRAADAARLCGAAGTRRTSKAARCVPPRRAARWQTRPPTRNRSTRAASWAGRRCTPGEPRATS